MENDLLVCSDEMHADIVYEKRKHIPLASLGESISQRTITLCHHQKSRNEWLGGAFAVIPNDTLRGFSLSQGLDLI